MAKKKKVSKKDMYKVDWSVYQRNLRFCFKKGYRIYPVTKNNVMYQVAIELGIKKAILSTEWEKKYVSYAISDAYKMIYDKHNTEQKA